jgi:hypothetical protein
MSRIDPRLCQDGGLGPAPAASSGRPVPSSPGRAGCVIPGLAVVIWPRLIPERANQPSASRPRQLLNDAVRCHGHLLPWLPFSMTIINHS